MFLLKIYMLIIYQIAKICDTGTAHKTVLINSSGSDAGLANWLHGFDSRVKSVSARPPVRSGYDDKYLSRRYPFVERPHNCSNV